MLKKTNLAELQSNIPDINGLATKTTSTAVKIKYLMLVVKLKKQNITQKLVSLKKKLTDHNHDKYITTPESNTLAADIFNARLVQANLITKTDFDDKLSSLNRKITSSKSKHLIVENELKKLKKIDSSYFIWQKSF